MVHKSFYLPNLSVPRLRAVPIFPLEFVEPPNTGARKRSQSFRAPAFRGSTNSRGKLGTARRLVGPCFIF